MTRPLRLEFPGALYHVTARGDRRGAIYCDDVDRIVWLKLLEIACAQFNFIVHAFCQMENHYHLLVETIDGDLSGGMRQLNGAYSQQFNRRHGLVGHVFQGRYKAILVQKESYLLELSRYIVLNPIRANMVTSLDDWRWSSYRYFMQPSDLPPWLDPDFLLAHFGADRTSARSAYKAFVLQGLELLSPLRDVQHQMLLGEDAFVAQHFNADASDALRNIVRTQRRSLARSLDDYAAQYGRCNEAMARAHRSMAFSMQEIATYFGTSIRTVGRAVKQFNRTATEAAVSVGDPAKRPIQ
jgi:putative transposase